MGPAINGTPLSWEEAQSFFGAAQSCAVKQLLRLWRHCKERTDPEPLWGDELEFTLIELNPTASCARLLLAQEDFMKKWDEVIKGSVHQEVTMQWECATYMVESTPAKPFGGSIKELLQVEENMRKRRRLIERLLKSNQHVTSVCVFPQLGASCKFAAPDHKLIKESAVPLPLELVGNPETQVPIFRDQDTPSLFHDKVTDIDDTQIGSVPSNIKENNVYLGDMKLGMGCCCLQVTFQARNEYDARWLHDQFIPLGPVMLALSAAAPIWKGNLVDNDSRWQRFADCFDDRTAEEMEYLPQRCTYNRVYISSEKPPRLDDECNKHLRPEAQQIKHRLVEGGIDEPLAVHFASVLSRDPLLLTRDNIQNMDEHNTDFFDQLYTGTWPMVRLKLPMDDAGPGWRVEFRPMEIQLSDSHNAAFAIFMYLLSRAITVFHLNFYIPIAKVGDSMERSQRMDAARKEKLWFRRAGWSSRLCKTCLKENVATSSSNGFVQQRIKREDYALMTLDEIINGESKSVMDPFPGLISIVQAYLTHAGYTESECALIQPYIDLVGQRANGQIPTPARWMRSFVAEHEDYKKDSHVSEKVCYDMMTRILELKGQMD